KYVAVTDSVRAASIGAAVAEPANSSRRSANEATVSIANPFSSLGVGVSCSWIQKTAPGRGVMFPAAWYRRPLGRGLEACVRIEDALPDGILRAAVLGRGAQQRKTSASSVDGVLPGRKRHVLSPIATFPDCKADQFHPAERA